MQYTLVYCVYNDYHHRTCRETICLIDNLNARIKVERDFVRAIFAAVICHHGINNSKIGNFERETRIEMRFKKKKGKKITIEPSTAKKKKKTSDFSEKSTTRLSSHKFSPAAVSTTKTQN